MPNPETISNLILLDDDLLSALKQVFEYQFSKRSRRIPDNWLRFLERWARDATDIRMCGNLRKLLAEVFPKTPVSILGARSVHCVLVKDQPILLLPEYYNDKPFRLRIGCCSVWVANGDIQNIAVEGMRKTSHGYAFGRLFEGALTRARCHGSFVVH